MNTDVKYATMSTFSTDRYYKESVGDKNHSPKKD